MRYQIWNKTDDVYTPSGAHFTAEEWAAQYPWVKIPGAKMIITTGVINGGAAMEFESTKDFYRNQGAAITDSMTDEEVLAAIEEFENNPPDAKEPSNEERIAAALEAQVMLAEPETEPTPESAAMFCMRSSPVESPALARIKRNVERGLWGTALVRLAVKKGRITPMEYQDLTGETYAG